MCAFSASLNVCSSDLMRVTFVRVVLCAAVADAANLMFFRYLGGYSSSYSPVSVVAESFWYDYFVSYEEFKEIASKHVATALIVGRHSIYLTPPPKSCPASGPFTLSLTLPHYHGDNVNVSLTSDPPGLINKAFIFWNTSATVKVGPQSFTVTCGNGTEYTRVYLALTADSDNVHYTIDEITESFSVAADLPEPMFNLNITGVRPYFASPVDPASMSIALNGINQVSEHTQQRQESEARGASMPQVGGRDTRDRRAWQAHPQGRLLCLLVRSLSCSCCVLSCVSVCSHSVP